MELLRANSCSNDDSRSFKVGFLFIFYETIERYDSSKCTKMNLLMLYCNIVAKQINAGAKFIFHFGNSLSTFDSVDFNFRVARSFNKHIK